MDYKITAITLQKRNRQRVNIYLDGEFAFGLARITAAWLQIGEEISDEKIAELKAADAYEVAHQQALLFMDYRPRSEAEVRQNLRKHGVSDEIIDAEVERLKESRLINDVQFAQAWVDNRAELRPRSLRALGYELHQRGVDNDVIQETLSSLDNETLAYQAAQKRARKFENLEWKDFRLKMLRYLAQRGFTYEVSAQAAAQIWEEISASQSTAGEEDNL
jgi:regulatory protein